MVIASAWRLLLGILLGVMLSVPGGLVGAGLAHAQAIPTGTTGAVATYDNDANLTQYHHVTLGGSGVLDRPDPGASGYPVAPSSGLEAPRGLPGSGPVSGVLEVSPGVRSTAAFENFRPGSPVEFVFDPSTQRFVVGQPNAIAGLKGSPHQQLAQSIGAGDGVVGGMFSRGPGGQILTNEASGHFWRNWNASTRQAFTDFMSQYGGNISHTPGM